MSEAIATIDKDHFISVSMIAMHTLVPKAGARRCVDRSSANQQRRSAMIPL